MRAGAYNLGFLALGNTPESNAFIKWWEDKLEYGAVSDPARGLFTDQKWIDLAPGMFGGFAILRDAGYNAAYWNLPHRSITFKNNQWFANDVPLRFFHFSGFDPINPKPFSKHQDRLTLDTIGDAKKLALIYAQKVISYGLSESRKLSYAFGQFSNGSSIPNALRFLFRENEDVRFQAGDNPFEAFHFFIHGEIAGLPVIMYAIWLEHQHLQRAFPDPIGIHRLAYFHWFSESGAVEIGIPEIYVLPIRTELKKMKEAVFDQQKQSPLISELPSYKPSIWARALVFLHKRATGGVIHHARLTQYQQVTNPIDFFKLGYAQFRGSKWADKLGLSLSNKPKLNPLQITLRFQTNSKIAPTNIVRRHANNFSGLYTEENQTAWWVGRQARFILYEPECKTIQIAGIFFPELIEKVNGQRTMELAIGFNDLPRKTVLVNTHLFEIEIEIDELPQTWPAVLHIIPSTSFVPKDIELNDDSRRLSIQIANVRVNQKIIFNALNFKTAKKSEPNITPGVNVIGYAKSEHGVGQSLRQFTHALDHENIAHVVIDFNKNNLSRTNDSLLDEKIVEAPSYDINVFHINADQMNEAEMQLPSHLFSRYNIGFWHWELPNMLPEHLSGFNLLNEVWVPTAFVQESVAKLSPIPVVKIPHAISFNISADVHRSQFGLPEDKFLFLMMYDFSSFQERKNPQATIDAYTLAFGLESKNVTLVIKTQNAHHHPKDSALLKDSLANRNDIIWINETLNRQDVYDLQSVCDCLVSLHRSEGYGLGPAEAMFLGKPVIATNWSGNTEFMRQDNSLPVNFELVTIQEDHGVYKAGQIWANPDIEHAAKCMREISTNKVLYQRISKAAERTMREEFSPQVIGNRIRQRLCFIQNEIIQKSHLI